MKTKKKAIATALLLLAMLLNISSSFLISAQDKNTPLALEKIGHMTNGAKNVRVIDDIAYVLADAPPDKIILKIFDVSDPANPIELATVNDERNLCHSLEVDNGLAFIADHVEGEGLEIINVSNPLDPQRLAKFSQGNGSAGGVFVRGSTVYLADLNDGLEIINASDPTDPVRIGQYYDGRAVTNVHVTEDIAYLCEPEGLEIIDVSNRSSPSLLSNFDDRGAINAATAAGNLAYITTQNHGLVILDISDPKQPDELSSFYDGGEAVGVQILNDMAFVADLTDGFELIDVSDPSNPVELGQFNTGGSALYLHVAGNLVYVADQLQGVSIIKIWQESSQSDSAPGFELAVLLFALVSLAIRRRLTMRTQA
ncbi:MAG: LVIVD repeat-containing protein [Candidatus Thorarchaeota archaeon]